MNNKKICFIMCVNNQLKAEEALNYINRLIIPEGYTVDCLTVTEQKSMTAGYNEAMKSSDAKYKVYMHQDVLILNENFIEDMLSIFQDKTIGMLGMVGTPKLPSDAIMWHGPRVGKILTWNHSKTNLIEFGKISGKYQEVEAVDGLLIATQYDVMWREDLFDKWDFYDVSSGFEMRRKGYKVVVPSMLEPWCLHDDGVMNLVNYYVERGKFIKEYL